MHNTTAVVIMLNLFEDMKSNCDGKYFLLLFLKISKSSHFSLPPPIPIPPPSPVQDLVSQVCNPSVGGWRRKQEDDKFDSSLGYIVKTLFQKTNQMQIAK